MRLRPANPAGTAAFVQNAIGQLHCGQLEASPSSLFAANVRSQGPSQVTETSWESGQATLSPCTVALLRECVVASWYLCGLREPFCALGRLLLLGAVLSRSAQLKEVEIWRFRLVREDGDFEQFLPRAVIWWLEDRRSY